MLRAECFLLNRQGAAVERFGFGVVAHRVVKFAKLLRLVAVSGCSGPSTFSRIAKARR